jgi:intein-encoded DNA endonuclease-like protein
MKKVLETKLDWSPEVAYAIGLITTDGSLSIDGRHIVFVSKDRQLITTFKKCLNLNNKIGLRKSSFTQKKIYYHVQFSNVNFYNRLTKLGLSPNKTKTIRALSIPNKFFMDFLRGHFDGDGYFYSFWDKRWPNSFMFYTNFISSSFAHIQWLREKINALAKIKGHVVRGGKSTWVLRFAKKESLILLHKIYYDKNAPCLLRKKRKVAQHVSIL